MDSGRVAVTLMLMEAVAAGRQFMGVAAVAAQMSTLLILLHLRQHPHLRPHLLRLLLPLSPHPQ